ncbi:MAG: hypothetical protein WDA35_03205 [Bacilli bacterium]|jgi:flagellar basal-body rod protein FlgB
MDQLSAAIMVKALDGLSARAAATSQNIANAQTAGYRPARVSFEAALAAAASRGPGAVEAVQPEVRYDPAAESAGVRLDQELATAASTALRYGAIVEMLGRQLQLQSLAATGGR